VSEHGTWDTIDPVAWATNGFKPAARSRLGRVSTQQIAGMAVSDVRAATREKAFINTLSPVVIPRCCQAHVRLV